VNFNGTEQYGYSPDNRRVYQKTPSGTQLIHFYGANGDRLRTYTYYGNGQFQVSKTNLYFAGRVILQNGQAAFVDRLGSDRRNTRYYPYWEEYTATANDRDKFATYFRDSSTGLDYAMNRYYGSNLGRFLTPDPYGGSARPDRPESWHRYAYASDDPVNRNDPTGLESTQDGILDEQQLKDCIERKTRAALQNRDAYVQDLGSRLAMSSALGVARGAIFGAYAGATGFGGMTAGLGTIPGATLGAVIGAEMGGAGGVLSGLLLEPFWRLLYDWNTFGPELERANIECALELLADPPQ
jgi:RHS repeat-associated protein